MHVCVSASFCFSVQAVCIHVYKRVLWTVLAVSSIACKLLVGMLLVKLGFSDYLSRVIWKVLYAQSVDCVSRFLHVLVAGHEFLLMLMIAGYVYGVRGGVQSIHALWIALFLSLCLPCLVFCRDVVCMFVCMCLCSVFVQCVFVHGVCGCVCSELVCVCCRVCQACMAVYGHAGVCVCIHVLYMYMYI